jgi:hypothetical protein
VRMSPACSTHQLQRLHRDATLTQRCNAYTEKIQGARSCSDNACCSSTCRQDDCNALPKLRYGDTSKMSLLLLLTLQAVSKLHVPCNPAALPRRV